MSDTDPIAAATAILARDEGTWDAEMEITPSPGAPPIRQTGVATNRLICNGRWLVIEYRGEGGFEGHGVYGWDTNLGRFVGTWVDSTRGSLSQAEGTWDAATSSMTYVTEMVHAGRSIRYREVTTSNSDGTRTYRNIVELPGAGWHEMIRTTYRRTPR